MALSAGTVPGRAFATTPPTGLRALRQPVWTSNPLAVYGPLARSALDLRLLYDVLAGDTAETDALVEESVSLRDFRVAVWGDDKRRSPGRGQPPFGSPSVSPAVGAAVAAAAAAAESGGASVSHTARPTGLSAASSLKLYKAMLQPDPDLLHTEWLALAEQRAEVMWR
jgi:Asp-tRNA(Asn)/Glu-tRNA(Gln) amidotransferase A subunit family amidase